MIGECAGEEESVGMIYGAQVGVYVNSTAATRGDAALSDYGAVGSIELGTINHTDGFFLAGTFTDHIYTAPDGIDYSYKICTFTADKISIGLAVIVNVQGRNALSLKTRNHGDITISTAIAADGGDAPDSDDGGQGQLGGWDGGDKQSDGHGPGKGKDRTQSNDGGGGGYGGYGWTNMNQLTTHGLTYGDRALTHLLGGSGGGGGSQSGGAGGGAIELMADGSGSVTISAGAKITVNGGDTKYAGNNGGGGSGGSIRLRGGSITNNGILEARGAFDVTDRSGGGGRISFSSDGSVTTGSTDISGFQPGTVSVFGSNGVSDLIFSSGTLVFSTTDGTWRHSDGKHDSDG
eukprot:gene13379-biopygen5268